MLLVWIISHFLDGSSLRFKDRRRTLGLGLAIVFVIALAGYCVLHPTQAYLICFFPQELFFAWWFVEKNDQWANWIYCTITIIHLLVQTFPPLLVIFSANMLMFNCTITINMLVYTYGTYWFTLMIHFILAMLYLTLAWITGEISKIHGLRVLFHASMLM